MVGVLCQSQPAPARRMYYPGRLSSEGEVVNFMGSLFWLEVSKDPRCVLLSSGELLLIVSGGRATIRIKIVFWCRKQNYKKYEWFPAWGRYAHSPE